MEKSWSLGGKRSTEHEPGTPMLQAWVTMQRAPMEISRFFCLETKNWTRDTWRMVEIEIIKERSSRMEVKL